MKEYYTIQEMASLYGVSNDALRYYEKLSLITPKRGENGYRLYGLKDVYRLTLIRDLLQLGISTKRIKEHLEQYSINETLALLHEEEQLVAEQINALKGIQKSIQQRKKILTHYGDIGKILKQNFQQRPCLRIDTDIRRDEEVDFAIKKLHHRVMTLVPDLGIQPLGAEMDFTEASEGSFGHYNGVFFLLPAQTMEYDFLLSEGEYLSLTYQGAYHQGGTYATKLQAYVQKNRLQTDGRLLEIYHIDNRYTQKEQEFVTELQIRLLPPTHRGAGAPAEH